MCKTKNCIYVCIQQYIWNKSVYYKIAENKYYSTSTMNLKHYLWNHTVVEYVDERLILEWYILTSSKNEMLSKIKIYMILETGYN